MTNTEWLNNNLWWLLILWLWSLVWKGFALWRSAQKHDKAWFIAFLIINSVGLLEMFYLFIFSKRDKTFTPAE